MLAGDLGARGVAVLVQDREGGQPGSGRDVADGVDDDVVAGQGPSAPGEADLAEQPVLDLVPLGGAGPIPGGKWQTSMSRPVSRASSARPAFKPGSYSRWSRRSRR